MNKERIQNFLRIGGLVVAAVIWVLDWIGRITVFAEPPPWLNFTLHFITNHWVWFEPASILFVIYILVTNERKRNRSIYLTPSAFDERFGTLFEPHRDRLQIQINQERLCRMAAVLFAYTMQYKSQVEQPLSEYMDLWKRLEDSINNPESDWTENDPRLTAIAAALSQAYQLFEYRCEGLFMMKPKVDAITPQPLPPEISHVRPDSIRRTYKELWLQHQARLKAVGTFKEIWNEILADTHETLNGTFSIPLIGEPSF